MKEDVGTSKPKKHANKVEWLKLYKVLYISSLPQKGKWGMFLIGVVYYKRRPIVSTSRLLKLFVV